MSNQNFPCSNMFLMPVNLLVYTSENSVPLFCLYTLSRELKKTVRCPLSHLFSRLNKPTSWCLFMYAIFPCAHPSRWSPLDLFHSLSIFLLLGNPELDTMQPNQCWIERKDHSDEHASCSLANAAQDTIDCLCCKGIFLARVQLFAYQDCQVLFWLTPPSSQCPPLLVHGFVTSQMWDCVFLCWASVDSRTAMSPVCPGPSE